MIIYDSDKVKLEKKVQYYYIISVIHIMRLLLLTIVYITSCFGVDDSFFEDVDNDLSGYKVYRANPKNVNEANLLAELHKSSKVVLIWLMKYTDQVRVSVWFLEWFWYNGCPW